MTERLYIGDGNKSWSTPTQIVACVTAGGAYGRHPSIYKVIGLESRYRMHVTESLLSRSGGSGSQIIELDGDGLYAFSGLAISNRGDAAGWLKVDGDIVTELDRDAFETELERSFPSEWAKREEACAQKALAKAQAQAEREIRAARIADMLSREPFDPLESFDLESGVCETLWFNDRPGLIRIDGSRVEQLTFQSREEDFYHVASVPLPGAGIYEYRNLYAGSGLADGFIEIKDGVVRGLSQQEAMEALRRASGGEGLPALSGTPKQIKWALSIRAEFAKSNPKDPRLKRAKTAKYWIEHRHELYIRS